MLSLQHIRVTGMRRALAPGSLPPELARNWAAGRWGCARSGRRLHDSQRTGEDRREVVAELNKLGAQSNSQCRCNSEAAPVAPMSSARLCNPWEGLIAAQGMARFMHLSPAAHPAARGRSWPSSRGACGECCRPRSPRRYRSPPATDARPRSSQQLRQLAGQAIVLACRLLQTWKLRCSPRQSQHRLRCSPCILCGRILSAGADTPCPSGGDGVLQQGVAATLGGAVT